MISPIQRGSARLICADERGILLEELQSGAIMLHAHGLDEGKELLDSINSAALVLLHQHYLVPYAQERYRLNYLHSCVNAVYFAKELLAHNHTLQISPLGAEDFDQIWEHYHSLVDAAYLRGRLLAGEVFGGYAEGSLVGFVGCHAEGSIGLLEVLPQYRRLGYGRALTAFMTNRLLTAEMLPFSQLVPTNQASMALHHNLGFTIDTREVYWLFNV